MDTHTARFTNSPDGASAIPRQGNWLSRRLVLGLFSSFGWRIRGTLPNVAKAVVIGAPHTSNWDLVLTLATAYGLGIRLHWVGKHTLFRGPGGVVLRWFGGIPVDRRHPRGFVEGVIDTFRSREHFLIAITPEGTRSPVQQWKTGFYHIARGANVPLVLVAFDWGNKEVRLGPMIIPSGNLADDLAMIQAHYIDVQGKYRRVHIGHTT